MEKLKNDIQEDYCSFEVSKFLKEKGFGPVREWNPEYVWGYIVNEDTSLPELSEFKEEDYDVDGYYLRPTHALAIKWIRENFGIHIYVSTLRHNRWHFSYRNLATQENYELKYGDKQYDSPEEAESAAILYTLQNLIK